MIAITHTKTTAKFAFCVRDDDCDDLTRRKVYQVLPDPDAAKDHYLRVIDDSGEDYLYPAIYFVPLDLPREAQKALTAAR